MAIWNTRVLQIRDIQNWRITSFDLLRAMVNGGALHSERQIWLDACVFSPLQEGRRRKQNNAW